MTGSSLPPAPERRVLIGRIVKVRGLRGDLKILPITWDPSRLTELKGVWLAPPEGDERYLTFKRSRVEGGMVFVRFNEAPRRDLAEALVGSELFVDIDERSKLPADHYYHDDVVGCEVVCSREGLLGNLKRVLEMPANDVWEVIGERGEILVPVLRQVVDRFDLDNRTIYVTLPEGLIGTPDPSEREAGLPAGGSAAATKKGEPSQ